MLKKAKLYSLLAVIVASTVVGLFGLPLVANAQINEDEITCGIVEEPEICYTATYNLGSNGVQDKTQIYYRGLNFATDVGAGDIDSYFRSSPPSSDNLFFDDADTVLYGVTNLLDSPWQGDYHAVIYNINEGAETAQLAVFEGSGPYYYFEASEDNGEIPFIADLALEQGTPEDQGNTPGGGIDGLPSEAANSSSSCQIKGIGWFLCPVVLFLAEVTDTAYWALDNTFLKLEPIALPGGTAADSRMQLYESWKVMRDIANIVFIVSFLIIVFSQLTNVGVSNYGIKRLLPKIVIAAILVNVSYFLCAVAVDLSNILGNNLRALLMPEGGASLDFDFSHGEGGNEVIFQGAGFYGLAGIILGATISAGLVYLLLPTFLPLVISAAVAILTVIIALTIRQALVVMLIVIAPLAFVALLLPNTETYFQKWRSLFTAMLLVYPIISVIFGASALASRILMTSTNDWPTQMIGAGVAIVPLALTPIVMKASGGLLNRWMGIVNDPSKGWVDGKRNALAEKGKVIKAGRDANSIARTGNFVGSDGNKVSRAVLGGANSRRRSAMSFFTPYGEKARKDQLDAGESAMEGAYLGTEGGRASRIDAANAKAAVQNAQIQADTVRIESPEGIALEKQSTELGMRKQAAANTAQADALNTLSSTIAGQQILRDSKEADLSKTTAESRVSAYQAGRTIDDPAMQALIREQQQNQTATSVAQGVTTRRFNKEMADGSVDAASALGISGGSAAFGEVQKAVAAAKTEAGEKEVRREQQALKEDLAKVVAGGGDADTELRTRASAASDGYELSAVFNEMAQRGRDSLIVEQQGIHATGSPERIALEEAIQGSASSLKDKAPYLIKGKDAAFSNPSGEQVAGWTPTTMKTFADHLKAKVDTGDYAYAAAATKAFNGAINKIASDSTLAAKFDSKAGRALTSQAATLGIDRDPDLSRALSLIGTRLND